MPLIKTLSRSLRARDDDSASDPYSDELEGSSPSVLDTGNGDDGTDAIGSSDNQSEDEGEDDDSPDEEIVSEGSNSASGNDSDEEIEAQLRKVPLGALAKAHAKAAKEAAPNKKRKQGQEMSQDTEGKLQALRERLKEIREVAVTKDLDTRKTGASKAAAPPQTERKSDVSSQESHSDPESDSDSDAGLASKSAKRSKHAPSALPSNKAVTRKRTVVDSNRPSSTRSKDPRFMAMPGARITNEKLSKDYAFLNDYRQSEIAALKARLGESGKSKKGRTDPSRKPKAETLSQEEKDKLKRELVRMESQEQARREKERLEDVAKKHKRAEKEKVAQGKKAFFLKKSEQKKLALVDKFEGMKGKQRDRAIDRRRKKLAVRERRAMPASRRAAAG